LDRLGVQGHFGIQLQVGGGLAEGTAAAGVGRQAAHPGRQARAADSEALVGGEACRPALAAHVQRAPQTQRSEERPEALGAPSNAAQARAASAAQRRLAAAGDPLQHRLQERRPRRQHHAAQGELPGFQVSATLGADGL
jgi:hypothetical protein